MFGIRLRNLRAKNNLTQDDLARIFGISKSAVGMYEREEREPSLDLVNKIADYFEVSVDYLLGRIEPSSKDRVSELLDDPATPAKAKEMLKKIMNLSPEKQKVIDDLLNTLSE